jgi:hypothetical protein
MVKVEIKKTHLFLRAYNMYLQNIDNTGYIRMVGKAEGLNPLNELFIDTGVKKY